MPNNCLQSIRSSKNDIRSFKTLDFRYNKLAQIPKLDYPLLSFYDLSRNSINTVSKTDFTFTKDVMFVNLSNNNLRSLPQDILKDLHLLRELNLSHNLISDLFENIFDENKELEKLDMSYNQLTKLSKFIFNMSDKLEVINMSNNKIKYVDLWFGMLNRLKVLRLESNDIIEL
uniref:Uncharacterized protein n=1 Tax=Strigamia maritima TaxID=126957 RepID=T1IMZ8_STRMM